MSTSGDRQCAVCGAPLWFEDDRGWVDAAGYSHDEPTAPSADRTTTEEETP